MAGCSTLPSMNPVSWWHRQEGGKIAEARPAPPGANQPYPNLSTVPAKPAPPDQAALKKLTDSLVADRTNAQHAAQSAPPADPSSPTASPSLFGVGTAPPPPPPTTTPPAASGAPGTSVASASLPAVTAPPPSPAPRKAVQSTSLEAPSTPTGSTQAGANQAGANQTGPSQAAPSSATAKAGASPDATPVASTPSAGPPALPEAPPPALPETPPPAPAAAGPVPATPVVPTPMPAPSAGQSATIVFPERASDLSQPATGEVKAFAAKRGNATISVTGFGDSSSSDPNAQSAALNLGLSRAQSIVDALKAAGVPGDAIRVSAEASGRGASLQLLQ